MKNYVSKVIAKAKNFGAGVDKVRKELNPPEVRNAYRDLAVAENAIEKSRPDTARQIEPMRRTARKRLTEAQIVATSEYAKKKKD